MSDIEAFVRKTLAHNKRIHEIIPEEEYLHKAEIGEFPSKLRDFADLVPEERNPRALFKGGYLRKGWGTDEFAAYVGAGGAELVNWMRAMLVLMPTGVPRWYSLIAAKRGRPLRWPMIGKKANMKLVTQSDDIVFWREPAPVDVPKEVMALFGGDSKAEAKKPEDVAALLGGKCIPLAVQLSPGYFLPDLEEASPMPSTTSVDASDR